VNKIYRKMRISAILVLTLVLFAGVTTAYADAAKPDLVPTDITPPSSIIVDIPTAIDATVNNTGSKDATDFNVTLAVNGTIVDTQSVSDLDKADSTTVSFTWTPAVAGDYILTVTADPEDVIDESDETNNNISMEVTAYTSGYMGGSLTTYAHDVVRGDLLYTIGNSTYRGSMPSGETYTVDFNITGIPSGATVKIARLYSYWSYSYEEPGASMDVTFDGTLQTQDASYIDRKGYGSYDRPYGTYAYDITISDNGIYSATINNTGTDKFSIYAMGLLIIYEDNSNEVEYWIDEGADIISAKYVATPEQATTDAPFDGTVTLADVESARLITVIPSGDKGLNTLLFNSYTESGIWNTTNIAVEERDVTAYITSTGNLAQLRDNEDFMMPSGAFLVMQRFYVPPVSSGVSLGATIIPAVSIEVTPDTLDFGTLAPGQTSSEQTLGISNTGASNVTVTADVADSAGNLYVSGLLLDSGIWSSYSATVEKAASVNAGATLEVPGGYTGVGTQEGTLILWAEKV
jgi:Protein of unknown function (DUF3344)/CARDB